MTARKPVHSHLSPHPNVTYLDDSNNEYDSEDLEESTNVPGSPKKQATPEVDIREKTTPVKPEKKQKIETRSQSNWGPLPWKILILVAIVAIAYSLWPSPAFKSCSFAKLQKENQQSENVWKALKVGIENMLNKKQVTPNVYLFLYQDPSLEKLTEEIASETSRCFGYEKVIKMDREDFITEGDDYGYAIRRYKEKIEDGKVLAIINLTELPANAARALHTICDTVSPIAEDVVIFLTLKLLKQVNPNKNSVQLALDTLKELWGTQLSSNELDPLIIRVMDQVLHLKS
ncbi:uncharacterized protein Dwil_GK16704 [Drosophila willistoni]|uniref:Uncharacterized protein n=1 Tax=Drosophila willistoni TaxID=7260 RepID=B4MMJ9_DROWI|nr:uncharacterized protein LOC6638941 [Drosophila willistoni]EDW73344.1 uncharacterized protein Dwil_GK16704 [Drosophila willistoni]